MYRVNFLELMPVLTGGTLILAAEFNCLTYL